MAQRDQRHRLVAQELVDLVVGVVQHGAASGQEHHHPEDGAPPAVRLLDVRDALQGRVGREGAQNIQGRLSLARASFRPRARLKRTSGVIFLGRVIEAPAVLWNTRRTMMVER